MVDVICKRVGILLTTHAHCALQHIFTIPLQKAAYALISAWQFVGQSVITFLSLKWVVERGGSGLFI